MNRLHVIYAYIIRSNAQSVLCARSLYAVMYEIKFVIIDKNT